MTKPTSALHWLWLSALVIGLDQFSKYLAETHLSFQDPQPLLPSLNLTLMYNTGAAFSFLSDAGGWQRWLFTGLAIAVSAALVLWLKRLPATQRAVAIALAAILGGALGNVIDRIRLGHVIDFIDVYYRGWHWPAFNIADSAITLGVTILIVDAVFGARRRDEL
ncbi:MAG: signal peptidase II [Gammaproteobacteria bacterium]